MARKKKKQVDEDEIGLSDEVRKSIVAIAIVAVGVLLLLSFFGFAGTFGATIDGWLGMGFGLPRLIVPVLLIVAGISLVFSSWKPLSARTLFSIALLLISITGLGNLFFAPGITDLDVVKNVGGGIGLLTSSFLVGAMGFWAACLIALSIMLVALIILSNRPLHTFAAMFSRSKSEEGEDEAEPYVDERDEVEDGGEPPEAEVEEGEEAHPKGEKAAAYFANKSPAETVMTSSERRKIEIPLDLLDNKRSEGKAGDIGRNQEIIARTLAQFGIDVEMNEVKVGPTVAQYAFRPAVGVKLARVVALQNDLALALAAHPIRIEAPIPGKALVGIEVPNQSVAHVGLREGLESKEFNTRKSAFAVPLGKDISGSTPLLYVEKAPHMLVAGATGSGKSVCLNGIIISLLYQNGPDDLKLIMVDPKRVELGVYAGIPHLLVPPIVKADEAVNALKWAVREMERRLDYLAKFGARDIDSYNAKAAERMPRIVIIIDELADLMIQNKREVEAVIVRIAQMARAAGIHLVLATQRPSVDVITGTIKANIPTRLAFAVASQVDSKTILDTAGADKLLGRGDMLMSTPEMSKPRRVQGAYVSDVEIERVVAFLKKESEPDYNYQIIEGASSSGGVSLNPENSDPLLEEAIEIAIDAGKVSTSFLQRRMKVGYSRAARIVDLMEEIGVVGPADGAKPREVLVSEWPPAGAVPDEDFSEDEEEKPEEEPEEEEENAEEGEENEDEETEEDEDDPELEDIEEDEDEQK
jgi:S-DNA-T family DNA segregation ATPase FtsK/SpoIIIE